MSGRQSYHKTRRGSASEISANVVAWYAAVVATISAGVNLYSAWRDRFRIKIKYKTGMFVGGNDSLYDRNKKHIVVSVINCGIRPVNIKQAYVQILNSDDSFRLTDSFAPHRIKVLDERSPETNFLAPEDHLDIKHVYKVVVIDGFGKEHIKYIKYFPTLPRLYYKLKRKLNARDTIEPESEK